MMPPDATAETLVEAVLLLRRISEQLEALPAAIASASKERGRSLTGADREQLECLLPAISRAIGNATFTARDLAEHASHDTELAAAFERAMGSVTQHRRIGKLLARAAGVSVLEHRIERRGSVRDGVLWRVQR